MTYTPTTWQDSPSTATPINATNLNNLEQGVVDADAAITALPTDANAVIAARVFA